MKCLRLMLLCGLMLLVVAGCGQEEIPQAGDPCSSLQDCALNGELSCFEDTCQRIECTATPSCPAGAACVAGVCAVAECLNDSDCAAENAFCNQGECAQRVCSTNVDCPQGQVCRGAPAACLAPTPFCANDTECPVGFVCPVNTTAQCTPGCVTDTQCSALEYCDGTRCRARCDAQTPCPGNTVCLEEQCIDPPDCSASPECPPDAPVRDAATCACHGCLEDAQCDTTRNEACVARQCWYCPTPAQDQSFCQVQGLTRLEQCCVECIEDADCTQAGESCDMGRCIDAQQGACITDTQCANGQVCDGVRCVADDALESCTQQADCPTQFACYSDGRCRRSPSELCATSCPEPSRCVVRSGDTQGTCAGCTIHCQQQGCPEGTFCYAPNAGDPGYCADTLFEASVCGG